MDSVLRVLIVEDSELDSEVLAHVLQQAGYKVEWERVETADAMTAALEKRSWDLILSDHTMPRFSAPEALDIVKTRGLGLPFIVVSGTIGEDNAVAIMREGAHDYILKDNLTRLGAAVERELRDAATRQGRKAAEETIRHLAFHDRLTGLPNQASLRLRLEDAIRNANSQGRGLAVLLINLDTLKEINNTLGRVNGDLLMKEAAMRLADFLEESQTLARPGGSEFAVIVPGGDIARATAFANNIPRLLRQPFILEELPVEIRATVGIALYPEHGNTPDLLMQHAAVAMWGARREARDYAFYEVARDPFSPSRLVLMGELRHAIEENQLVLHFQAKVDVESRKTIGAEALVRWEHPKRGFLPPINFIPLAEQSGLIRPLTQWVLNEALRQLQVWQRDGIGITMAVNLSTRSLIDPQLKESVSELLERWGVMPASLELEITESSLMAELSMTREILESLSGLGIRFSIDDFGTGYSSLAYLHRIPVAELKVDKSFVLGMASNGGDNVIVRSIVALGHDLGLKVVAEGVENHRLWDLLLPLHCDSAQGFYMAHPMSGKDMAHWFKESIWSPTGGLAQEGPI